MNDLSWLLYIGDVLSGLGGFLAFLAGVSLVIGFICIVYGASLKDNSYDFEGPKWQLGNKIQKKALAIGLPAFFVLGFVANLMPSKETVYAIAASEMGEKVMKTNTFNKATEALNAWLERQIKPDEEKK